MTKIVAEEVHPMRGADQVVTKRIIIEANRIEDTNGERAWLDLVDAISAVVYSSANGWNDSINLQMRRED